MTRLRLPLQELFRKHAEIRHRYRHEGPGLRQGVYCYANYSAKSVESNFQKYDPLSPLLCGHIEKDDRISTRKVAGS